MILAPRVSAEINALVAGLRSGRRDASASRRSMSTASVAVLGAGNGGMALAAYLAQQGHRVALWNRSVERLSPVRQLGGISLALAGSAPAHVPLAVVSERVEIALADARVILIAVPASAHDDVVRAAAPHLRDGQTVLLLPGRTGGALEFRRTLRDAGCRARILLGEANTFPLTSRSTGPAAAVIFSAKSELLAAALPAIRTAELIDVCRPLLPMIMPCQSVLHTGLANVGAILHPTITLLNAERIRRGESFDFYTEGVTPRVATVIAQADVERLRVAHAFGIATDSIPDWFGAAYGHHAASVLEAVGGNPTYVGIKAPTTLVHRYLLEDVPTGLIPLLELGRAAGLQLPTLRRLADAARSALGSARWQRARTLAALGLSGLTPAAIRALVLRDCDDSGAIRPPATAAGWCDGAAINRTIAVFNGS